MRLWIFHDFQVPTEDHLMLYHELGFTDIVLGVTTNRKQFKLNYTKKKWADAAKMSWRYNLTPHFMVWAIRKQSAIEDTFDVLVPLIKDTGVESLMFDAEGTWHKGREIGPTAAAGIVRDVADEYSLKVGVTGLDRLHSTVKPLAEVCDYILPQAYSFWKPVQLCNDGKHWSHSAHTFPGVQQRKAFESWNLPSKDFVMGLACYWGDRPKNRLTPTITDAQSMRFSMTETIAVWYDIDARLQKDPAAGKFRGAAYWSGKHLRGKNTRINDRHEIIRLAAAA